MTNNIFASGYIHGSHAHVKESAAFNVSLVLYCVTAEV